MHYYPEEDAPVLDFDAFEYTKQAAVWILKLKEKQSLTQVQYIYGSFLLSLPHTCDCSGP